MRCCCWIHDIWSKTISSKRRLVECDIWSIRRFADYDVSFTTTIGQKFVELRRNLVEIWSKTDSYRKNKKCLHLRFLHLQYIFTPVSVLVSLTFVYWELLYATFSARLLLLKNNGTSILNN